MSSAEGVSHTWMSETSPRARPRSMVGRTSSRVAALDSTIKADVPGTKADRTVSRKYRVDAGPLQQRGQVAWVEGRPQEEAHDVREDRSSAENRPGLVSEVSDAGSMGAANPGHRDGVLDEDHTLLTEVPHANLASRGTHG